MAHVLDILGKGEILTIDIDNTISRPSHPRVTFVHGSSADGSLIESLLADRHDEVCMVVLEYDSARRKNHDNEETDGRENWQDQN